jgi:hypothetical protein
MQSFFRTSFAFDVFVAAEGAGCVQKKRPPTLESAGGRHKTLGACLLLLRSLLGGLLLSSCLLGGLLCFLSHFFLQC